MTTSRSRTKISSFCNHSRRKPSRNWYQRSLTSYNPGALDLKVRGQIFWKQGDRILKLIQQVCILGGWGVHFNIIQLRIKKQHKHQPLSVIVPPAAVAAVDSPPSGTFSLNTERERERPVGTFTRIWQIFKMHINSFCLSLCLTVQISLIYLPVHVKHEQDMNILLWWTCIVLYTFLYYLIFLHIFKFFYFFLFCVLTCQSSSKGNTLHSLPLFGNAQN